MGRGLSELQQAILRTALRTRRETDPAIQARRPVDVYYYQILQAVHGWERERPWSTYGPGHHHFSAASVGPARYNAARAALTRAVQRLEQRGLVERYVGVVAYWTGLKLTPAGEDLANRLLVNHQDIVAPRAVGRAERAARMARRPRSMTAAARERRARRAVKRQGLVLRKGYPSGEWYLMEPSRKVPVRTLPDLETLEAWLSTKK